MSNRWCPHPGKQSVNQSVNKHVCYLKKKKSIKNRFQYTFILYMTQSSRNITEDSTRLYLFHFGQEGARAWERPWEIKRYEGNWYFIHIQLSFIFIYSLSSSSKSFMQFFSAIEKHSWTRICCATAQHNANDTDPLYFFFVRQPQPVTHTSVHLRKPT